MFQKQHAFAKERKLRLETNQWSSCCCGKYLHKRKSTGLYRSQACVFFFYKYVKLARYPTSNIGYWLIIWFTKMKWLCASPQVEKNWHWQHGMSKGLHMLQRKDLSNCLIVSQRPISTWEWRAASNSFCHLLNHTHWIGFLRFRSRQGLNFSLKHLFCTTTSIWEKTVCYRLLYD